MYVTKKQYTSIYLYVNTLYQLHPRYRIFIRALTSYYYLLLVLFFVIWVCYTNYVRKVSLVSTFVQPQPYKLQVHLIQLIRCCCCSHKIHVTSPERYPPCFVALHTYLHNSKSTADNTTQKTTVIISYCIYCYIRFTVYMLPTMPNNCNF